MGRKHKNFPDNDNKIKQKDKKIKELEKEIKNLKSQLQTLNTAFSKVSGYIKGNLENISVEKVIEAAKHEKTMVEIKNDNKCPSCKTGELKHSRLPFGFIELCLDGCGYRNVINEK